MTLSFFISALCADVSEKPNSRSFLSLSLRHILPAKFCRVPGWFPLRCSFTKNFNFQPNKQELYVLLYLDGTHYYRLCTFIFVRWKQWHQEQERPHLVLCICYEILCSPLGRRRPRSEYNRTLFSAVSAIEQRITVTLTLPAKHIMADIAEHLAATEPGISHRSLSRWKRAKQRATAGLTLSSW